MSLAQIHVWVTGQAVTFLEIQGHWYTRGRTNKDRGSRLVHPASILVGQVACLPEVALHGDTCIPVSRHHIRTDLPQLLQRVTQCRCLSRFLYEGC